MRIDLKLVEGVLREIRARDEDSQRFQPGACLGCFISLGLNDDSYCINCRNYATCSTYLRNYEKKEEVFKR